MIFINCQFPLPCSIKTDKALVTATDNVFHKPKIPKPPELTQVITKLAHPLVPPDTFQMNFRSHITRWSALILYRGTQKTYVSNTCTIDYCLFALWVLSK